MKTNKIVKWQVMCFQSRFGLEIGKYHIVTLEPITIGKIKRGAGQSLCNAKNGMNNMHLAVLAMPDCPRCIAIAERL